MANKTDLKLLLTAKDQTKKAFDSLNKNMKKAGDTSKKGAVSMKGMTEVTAGLTGGVAVAAVALKAMTDQLGDYLKLDQTMNAVDNALEKHGTNWEDLRVKMVEASGGMISEMQLLEKTGMGTTLGIDPEALTGMLDIARAASKGMGIEMSHAFDSIVTGTARQSRLLLDNIGVIVSVEDANKKYAESIGKTVKQLTEQEKKLAFQNEVLKQGQVIIEQFGGNTETAYESIKRMSTSLGDMAINATGIVTELLPVGDTFKFWADTAADASNAIRELLVNLKRQSDPYLAILDKIDKKRMEISKNEDSIIAGEKGREGAWWYKDALKNRLPLEAELNGLIKQRNELLDDTTRPTPGSTSRFTKTQAPVSDGFTPTKTDTSASKDAIKKHIDDLSAYWESLEVQEAAAQREKAEADRIEKQTQAEQFVQDRLAWQITELDIAKSHMEEMEAIQDAGLQKEADWAAIRQSIWIEQAAAYSNMVDDYATIGSAFVNAIGMNQKDQAKIMGPLEWLLGAKDAAMALTEFARHNYGDAAAYAASSAAHFSAARQFASYGGGGGGKGKKKKDITTPEVPGAGLETPDARGTQTWVINVPKGYVMDSGAFLEKTVMDMADMQDMDAVVTVNEYN